MTDERQPGEDAEPIVDDNIKWDVAADDPNLKSLKGVQLRCMCCGTFYVRGSFRCCAPPNGMDAGRWMELSCRRPPEGCGKCWKHCTCLNKQARIGPGPLAAPLAQLVEEAGLTEGLNRRRLKR